MNSRGHISAGQRYRDRRRTAFGLPSRTVWTVERVWQARDGRAYAELVEDGDAQHRKTLAITAISDRSLFAPIAEASTGSKVSTGGEIGAKPLSA